MSPSQTIEERVRELLDSPPLRGNLTRLFCDVLGWGHPQAPVRPFSLTVPGDLAVTLTSVAQLSGLPVFRVDWPLDHLPNVVQRRGGFIRRLRRRTTSTC